MMFIDENEKSVDNGLFQKSIERLMKLKEVRYITGLSLEEIKNA
ncbi:hypothetical protein ANME2D_02604 [Candidatus Methanoperedens nitroreducens]|uniref:Uncharacterized protein n=1 Tax=Candidatus Methanoperedens nitratireducens TaxID=1392998 RepID=A0A062V1S7_9EURY|nr:hypothetical protein ANME2D_02604 [Candidatus Methanoperedens nitroreducens]MDJ1420437.1 hypothetical protein [Candidatus Methanoperedens sp.]